MLFFALSLSFSDIISIFVAFKLEDKDMSLKLIDKEEKKGLAKLLENIDIWWYCHVTDKYRSVCCWFRICCNKRRWKLVKQAAFHTYPFSYEYYYA